MIHDRIVRRRALRLIAGLIVAPAVGGAAFGQPRTFSIFFDRQSTFVTLTALRLLETIQQRIGASSHVTIVGHCDTSESNPDRLSRARALGVQKELRELGVPASAAFTVVGRGASEPKEPTPPNTPHPINRRVEVTVQ